MKRAHLRLLRSQIDGQINNQQVKPKGAKILQQNLIEITTWNKFFKLQRPLVRKIQDDLKLIYLIIFMYLI